jgi:hypothetical protein
VRQQWRLRRLAWARCIAVPLFSISSIEDVTKLRDVVTKHNSGAAASE